METDQSTEQEGNLVWVQSRVFDASESIGEDRSHDCAHAIGSVPNANTKWLFHSTIPKLYPPSAMQLEPVRPVTYQTDVITAKRGKHPASKSPNKNRVATRAPNLLHAC